MSPLILLFAAVGVGLVVVAYLLLFEKEKTQGSTTMSTNPGSEQKTDKLTLLLIHVLIGIGFLRIIVPMINEIKAGNPSAVINVMIFLALVIIVWNFYKWRKWALNALVVFLSVMILLVVGSMVLSDESVPLGLISIAIDAVTIILLYNHRVRKLF